MNINPPALLAPDALARQQKDRQIGQTAFMSAVANAPQGQMSGGHYVAPSWSEYLANGLQKYNASQMIHNNLPKKG